MRFLVISSLPFGAFVAAFVAATGCNGSDGRPAMQCEPARALSGHTALPAEIETVLKDKCHKCHSDPPRMYAPMPLVTWQDAQNFAPGHTDGPAIYELVGRRIHDARYPMPPKTQPQLTNEQRATLDAWIAQCAPPIEN